MKILVFGSSITEGYWATQGGWVQRLINDVAREHVEREQSAQSGNWITNLGVGGDTVRKVIERLAPETTARLGHGDEPLGFVFAMGANDSMKIGDLYLSTPEQFTADLQELYELATRYTSHIMFVGFTAMDPEGQATRQFFEPERLEQFETVLREFAEAHNTPFVPLREVMAAEQQHHNLLAFDGVHPNDAGHQVIYEQVKAALAPWLKSTSKQS